MTRETERWREQAACRGLDPKIFYPEKNVPVKAKAICARCPVREECLEYSLSRQVEYGVWGGTTQRSRRHIQKRRAQEARYKEKKSRA